MDRRDFPPDDPLYRAAGELAGWLDLEESGYRDGCPLSVVMDGLGFKGDRSGLGGSSVVRNVVTCGDTLKFSVVDNHSDFDVSRALAERLGVDISVEVSRSYVERGGLVWTTGPERFTARDPAALRRRIEDVIRRTVDLIGRPGEELEFGMFAPFRGMLIGSLGPGPDVVNLISKPATWESDYEGDGRRFYSDGPHIHEYLQELVREGGIDGLMTVGEMSSTSVENCIGYSNPQRHELGMTFSFHHLKVDYLDGNKWALKEPDIAQLRDLFATWQERMAEGGGWNALFWSNHDQPRPNSRFGDTERFWYESSTLLPTCTHLMRGTPYIYQGEELGQTITDFTSIGQYRDVESVNYYRILQEGGLSPESAFEVVHARSRDDGRTPMAWNDGPNAGFTMGEPWLGLVGNYKTINAEAEVADPHSVRAYFKELIRIRKESPVIQIGDIRFLEAGSDAVIAYERTLGDERVVVQCNFSGVEQPAVGDGGGEVLICNYDEPRDTATLRPWEARATWA